MEDFSIDLFIAQKNNAIKILNEKISQTKKNILNE